MPEESVVLNLQIEQASQQVNDAIDAGYRAALEKTKADAQSLSPKKTGHNAQSITTRYRRTQSGDPRASVYTQSGYGGFLEIGTKNMAAQPYIYPAAKMNFATITDEIAVKLKR